MRIDTVQLEQLIYFRGFRSPSEFARAIGVREQTITRLLDPRKENHAHVEVDTATRIAEGLNVTFDELRAVTLMPVRWKNFTWQDSEELENLDQDIERAKDCLICTQGMEAYLSPTAMNRWGTTQAHIPLGWEPDEIDAAFKTIDSRNQGVLERRCASSSIRRVIGQDPFFQRAFLYRPHWNVDYRQRIHQLDGVTAIGIVPELKWSEISKMILKAIRKCLARHSTWDKVLVADTIFAVFRPTRGSTFVTYHRPYVELLRGTLEEIATYVPYTFPQNGYTLDTLRDCEHAAVRRLGQIGREAEARKKGAPRRAPGHNAFWSRFNLGPQF